MSGTAAWRCCSEWKNALIEMSAQFVPFLQGLKTRLPLGSQATGGSFTPLGQPSSSSASPVAPETGCEQVKVDFKRDGERIQEIRIQCKCGEVIELLCEYGPSIV